MNREKSKTSKPISTRHNYIDGIFVFDLSKRIFKQLAGFNFQKADLKNQIARILFQIKIKLRLSKYYQVSAA